MPGALATCDMTQTYSNDLLLYVRQRTMAAPIFPHQDHNVQGMKNYLTCVCQHTVRLLHKVLNAMSIGGRTTGVPGQVCGSPVFKHHYRHEGRIQRRAYSAMHRN